ILCYQLDHFNGVKSHIRLTWHLDAISFTIFLDVFSVLGLEQFKLGHVNGGSQDYSRMIRLTYQDERYTRLAPDAFKTWRQIEKESGLQVFYKTGSLQLAEIGKSDFIINEYTKAMDRAGIKYEYLSNTDVMRRYPQFTVGPDIVALYQDMAGFVDAALGNSIHIQLARGNGATILEECAVTRLTRAVNGNIVVHTTNGKFECRRLIVAAGAWLNHVIGTIGVHVPVTVTQEQVTYLGTPHMKDFTKDK
ncbi:peroxisomal sarcosine oxidase-like, partial [Gigantopelta aegis]|uniref:peroxisomal sarcosine oxidase-like n=1 Tax=Gigantopelta aegis TaxID=1735272 RepID=UPI001B889EA9